MTCPAPGFYSGIDEPEYGGWDAVRSSDLKYPTEAHRVAAKAAGDKQTDAQRLGIDVHCAVLQPKVFAASRESELNAKDRAICTGIRDSLWSHPTISRLLEAVKTVEESAVWKDAETGLMCKMRMDAGCDGLGLLLDLKTTKNAAADAFGKDAWQYKYHVSAAHYLNGCDALGRPLRHFTIIAVEKVPPFAAAAYNVEYDLLEIGRQQRLCALQRIRTARLTNKVEGYPEHIQPLRAQSWMVYKFEKEMESI
jgi:hypothetical protein